MSIIGSSVTSSMIMAVYRCPHCNAEQQRLRQPPDTAMKCQNCLRTFDPQKAEIQANLFADKK